MSIEDTNDHLFKFDSLNKTYIKSGSIPLDINTSLYPVVDEVIKHEGALRYDEGKLPLHLLPPELMTEVTKVLQFGAKKYAPRNWEKGMDWSRVYDSLSRHLLAWWGGEDFDPETGLSHLSHVGCNIAFLIAYNSRGVGTDDRPNSISS